MLHKEQLVTGLWTQNSPKNFWLCQAPVSDEEWREAIRRAAPLLGFPAQSFELDELLSLSLGEARFGPAHWKLPLPLQLYYAVKPILPRNVIPALRRAYNRDRHRRIDAHWPIDHRFAAFQWDVLRQLLAIQGGNPIPYRALWPNRCRFAMVLTHDIETARGQSRVLELADLEEGLGLRSSFNFALQQYPLNLNLMDELRRRGFEVGCHGLQHDGQLFSSREQFQGYAAYINEKMREYGMRGFRSPLTLRHPGWMQSLEIQYDSSFFDTDPFEPIPGGVMTIWPFFLGRFVELPYTLVQDFALTAILGARTPAIWLDKVSFIRANRGMALINTHPDYLERPATWQLYVDFLTALKKIPDCWHALPHHVASWWRQRCNPAASVPTEIFSLRPAVTEVDTP